MTWDGNAQFRGGMAAYRMRVGIHAPGARKPKRRRRGRWPQRTQEAMGGTPFVPGEVISIEEARMNRG